jgi:hypothetical protein
VVAKAKISQMGMHMKRRRSGGGSEHGYPELGLLGLIFSERTHRKSGSSDGMHSSPTPHAERSSGVVAAAVSMAVQTSGFLA